MSKLIMTGSMALCAVVSYSMGSGQATAQVPSYGQTPQRSTTLPPGVQRTLPALEPNAASQMPTGIRQAQYGQPPTQPTQYPQTQYPQTQSAQPPNVGYAAPRVAGRPAAYTGPPRGTSSTNPFNAYGGNSGAISNSDFGSGSIQLPSAGDFSVGSNVQTVGHVTKGSRGCDCDTHSHYNAGCVACTDRTGLLPAAGGIRFGGWIQQGLTANFGDPSDRMNSPVLFNDRSNDYQLNQLYLYAERKVRNDGFHWELGGRIDAMLGTDARFLTVPGLEEHQNGTPKWNGESKQYGLAIPQAYVELAAPWLHGVSLKAGHFYSIAGYETAAAPHNFFYSHAYTYLYGEPFTHTGALFTAKPNDVLTLNAGYTKGWDVFESNSNEYGILASIKVTSLDKRTSLAATVHSGQDVTGVRSGGALIDEDRHFYSLVLQHQINDCLRYVFQHDFGYQEDGEVVVNIGPRTITFDEAKWYGINQYLIYEIDDTLATALRVEWFRDQDQSRVAVPVKFNPGGTTFLGGNYVAVTAGVNWRPNTNIAIRPEVRWDYSDLKGNGAAPGGDPNVRAFDDARHSNQVTAAFDVIITY